MVVFSCRSCDSRLTESLTELEDQTALLSPASLSLDQYMGEDYIPTGVYTVATSFESPSEYDIGQFIVNTDDATGIRMHDNPARTAGCCGLDGLDGPNVVCDNGHEVGTERSDCWTLHYVALDPEWVRKTES